MYPDGLTEEELEEYKPFTRKHTTGCPACDDIVRKTGNRTAACDDCAKQMQKYFEGT